MILALRTDKPEAELYLISEGDYKQVDVLLWQAHRQLSDTLLTKIDELLEKNSIQKADLTGLLVYQGPGSFTGLRIGISVMNTLSYSLAIPIFGATGEDWLASIPDVTKSESRTIVAPEYGSEARITQPRK